MRPGETTERFYSGSEAEQIQGLLGLAREAVDRWGLRGAEVSPVAYRENMTFAVDAGSRGRFALRVHQAAYRSDAEIRSELAFMRELCANGVSTPEVVPSTDGSLFVVVESPAVPEARQCDLFEWIDGHPLRGVGDTSLALDELSRVYAEVGRQAAAIANVAEAWKRPPAFSRPVWDADGIFGETALLGDFRKLGGFSSQERVLLERVAAKLESDLQAFGKAPDRFGLSHGDFLPENIMVCAGGIRLIDFDDCGESWFLFEFATALFDLLGQPGFDASLGAMVAGYRERRALPDEHVALLPAFLLARALSYLGWSATRSHLQKSREMAPLLLRAIADFGPTYLADGELGEGSSAPTDGS